MGCQKLRNPDKRRALTSVIATPVMLSYRMALLHFFRKPGISPEQAATLLRETKQRIPQIDQVETEYCFNVETTDALTDDEAKTLVWLLSETFDPATYVDGIWTDQVVPTILEKAQDLPTVLQAIEACLRED